MKNLIINQQNADNKKVEFSIKNSYQKTKIERELHRHTHVTVAARYQWCLWKQILYKKKKILEKKGAKTKQHDEFPLLNVNSC